MKNIFKKNHIIITALAIMIVIAGYLSFTNDDTPDDEDLVMTTNPDTDEYGDLFESDGMEMVTNDTTTTDDTTATDDTTTTDDTTATDDTTTDEDLADDTDITDTTEDAETTDENDETTPVDTEDAADELGENDISDEDILASADDVADNGELDLEDGVPGEAVLASAGLDSDFFITSKMEREQWRARSKEMLMDIIDSPDVSEESKKVAIQSMITLTEIAEKENNTEMMLGAKGFSDAVVSIVDGEVEVVVNAETLSDQQLAIIEDVVKSKTDISVENIHITHVVVAE